MPTPQHSQNQQGSFFQRPIVAVVVALLKILFNYPIAFFSGLLSQEIRPKSRESEDLAGNKTLMQENETNTQPAKKMDPLSPTLKDTNETVSVNDISLESQPNFDKYNFPSISLDELHQYDGSDFIYVGINGYVYDVSHRADAYGPKGSYGVFSNKDASRALAMSSLSISDVKDSEGREGSLLGLNDQQYKTLGQWESFFQQRYRIVATIPKPFALEGYEAYKNRVNQES